MNFLLRLRCFNLFKIEFRSSLTINTRSNLFENNNINGDDVYDDDKNLICSQLTINATPNLAPTYSKTARIIMCQLSQLTNNRSTPIIQKQLMMTTIKFDSQAPGYSQTTIINNSRDFIVTTFHQIWTQLMATPSSIPSWFKSNKINDVNDNLHTHTHSLEWF